MRHQLEQFELAAKDFPVTFERRIVRSPTGAAPSSYPYTCTPERRRLSGRPVLIASGGVDTWKMDIHPWWVGLTHGAGVTTVAFDQPGTGETGSRSTSTPTR